MTSSRTPLRALGLGLATLLATTLVTVAPPAGALVPDGPDYQMPDVGECHELIYEVYLGESDPSDAVDCTESHTSYVVATELLPDSLDWDSSLTQLSRAVTSACYPAWEDHLGGSEEAREMSAYALAWFMPSQEQRDHGARWFRCDVVLLGGSRVLALPSDTAPVLDTDLPDSVARCLTGAPLVTTCARSHRWRATGGFPLRTDSFPTMRQFERAAVRRCPGLTSTRRWRGEGPGKDAWRAGRRTMVCHSHQSG